MLSVIVSTWNSLAFLKPCLESLCKLNIDIEVIIVDSNSKDGTREYLDRMAATREVPKLTVLYSARKLDWSEANQLGIDVSQGDWICLSNPDILFNLDFEKLLDYAAKPQAEAIGPQLMHPDGRPQGPQKLMSPREILSRTHTVEFLAKKLFGKPPNHTLTYSTNQPFRLDHPVGSLFIVSTRVLDQLGGRLWHRGYKIGVSDSDAFMNFKANNIRLELYPSCRIVHFEGHKSIGTPSWVDYDSAYGLVLYFRYWKMSPRLMTVLLLIEGFLATVIDLVAWVNPRGRAWRTGRRVIGLLSGWRYRMD